MDGSVNNNLSIRRFSSLQDALMEHLGQKTDILRINPVHGGDINDAYMLNLSDGNCLFLKMNGEKDEEFFLREAEGLLAIGNTGRIDVPKLIGYGSDEGKAFLLMEFIRSSPKAPDFHEDFGHKLAAMHLDSCSAYTGFKNFGFISDNYIGGGRQENTPEEKWIVFFREHRLLPQLRLAEGYFDSSSLKAFDRLLERLGDILTEPWKPSLLHGDLWSGNYMTGADGKVVLIDPAVYVGHPEADIAMTELFGGFSRVFYDSYYEVIERIPGYEDRREIYNLYHLLNHLNLFGQTYLSPVLNIIRKFGR
ncbi:MAG: fructosamine kinase family protein [Lachnospiraceae bacterium]|nr:fructosamine kinase family protein [Lachnospiraceae bacterium]